MNLSLKDFPFENVALFAIKAMEIVDEIKECMQHPIEVPDMAALLLNGLSKATDLNISRIADDYIEQVDDPTNTT